MSTGPRAGRRLEPVSPVAEIAAAASISNQTTSPVPTSGARELETEKHNQFLRDEARALLRVFYWLNFTILSFIFLVWVSENARSWIGGPQAATPGHPIVTERVMMALIAASAAQLGALALSVGGALFRSR